MACPRLQEGKAAGWEIWPRSRHMSEPPLNNMQEHLGLLESSQEGRGPLLAGLTYLLDISFVADDEVFKITLDYWNLFVPEVYSR